MFRYSDDKKGSGFVFGIRYVVGRDNYNKDISFNPYSKHALSSCKNIEKFDISNCLYLQKKQICYRNLFYELPNNEHDNSFLGKK